MRRSRLPTLAASLFILRSQVVPEGDLIRRHVRLRYRAEFIGEAVRVQAEERDDGTRVRYLYIPDLLGRGARIGQALSCQVFILLPR